MVFSSIAFLHLFLPVVLALYFLLPRATHNALLLAASLLFYAAGEGWYVLIMLLSIAANWLFGLAIGASGPGRARQRVLAACVGANLALLGVFKYANFAADSLAPLLAFLGLPPIQLAPIHLPIGISFFTFQAISYIVDVARGDVRAQRDPIAYGMYKSFFPQLIAGPIVRYRDVATQVVARRATPELFAEGAMRFTIGLAKKALIGNVLAGPADQIFQLPAEQIPPAMAWYGVACYALQIYFDFSGYSDMAIGLGLMFGFRFLENFDLPYTAQSVREFWRRWHISLSTWFRDYLYRPLGGNRRGPLRTAFNLGLVFLLCGLWHGASWTFVVWGLWHGAFIAIEHLGLGRLLAAAPRPLRHAYLLLVVGLGWVWFRADTLDGALGYFGRLAGLGAPVEAAPWWLVLDAEKALAFALGVLFSAGLGAAAARALERAAERRSGLLRAWLTAKILAAAALLAMSSIALTASAVNPFIYFRF